MNTTCPVRDATKDLNELVENGVQNLIKMNSIERMVIGSVQDYDAFIKFNKGEDSITVEYGVYRFKDSPYSTWFRVCFENCVIDTDTDCVNKLINWKKQ